MTAVYYLSFRKPCIDMNKKQLVYMKQKGSALLSALFIMTLVAIAATAMMTRLRLDIYRAGLNIQSNKLYFASQAVIFWAMDSLKSKNPPSYAIDKKATLANYPKKYQNLYPMIGVKGKLIDMQSRLNINLIINKKFHIIFDRLLQQVLPEKSASQRKDIITALVQWIDDYQPDRYQYAFLNKYIKYNPPYLQGFQPMVSISELRLIHGISAKDYQRLSPYLSALPEDALVNIKTASKPILMSLGNGLKSSQADEIIKARKKKDDGELQKVIYKLSLVSNQFTVKSNYYMAVSQATSDKLHLTNKSLLMLRSGKLKKPKVNLILEQLNA